MATKIAFVITKLDLGGAQKSVLYTARHISDNFEPFLLCGQGGTLEKYAKDHIKNFFVIPSLVRQVNPIKDILAFKELAKKLKEIDPQIVHTNCPKAGILGRIAAKLFTKAKVVHTTHGFVFYEGQNVFKKYFYILIERFAALFADYMVFVSNKDLQTALKYKITAPQKARLIRAGVTPKAKESLRFNKAKLFEELGIKEGTKIVLQTANLKPEKNPLESVKIASLVCKQMPNTVFLYTGTGPLKEKTKNLIKELGLENNFKLIGEREDIPHLLSICNVFLLTSIREGLPMALLEALFMKVPAVCYNVGGIAEVLKNGENGFLIPFNNTQKAIQSIINILQGSFSFKEQTLAQMQDFDIKDMLLKQQELYTLIGDKNSLFTNC